MSGSSCPSSSDDEEYDFEYSDDDEELPDVDIENKFYEAKPVALSSRCPQRL